MILTTPQHEQFYRAIADPAETRTILTEARWDIERIDAACEKYHIEGVEMAAAYGA